MQKVSFNTLTVTVLPGCVDSDMYFIPGTLEHVICKFLVRAQTLYIVLQIII